MALTERIRKGYRELRWDHPDLVASPIDHEAIKKRPSKWVGEHRVRMSEHLGRALKPHEHIHHKDGNKLNNDPENLAVMNARAHAREHALVIKENQILRGRIDLLEERLAKHGISLEGI